MMLPSWRRSNCFRVWIWKSFQGGGSSKEAPLRWSRAALYLFILRTSFVAQYSPEGVPWNIFYLKRRVRSQDIWRAPGQVTARWGCSVLARHECHTLTHCLAELYFQLHTGCLALAQPCLIRTKKSERETRHVEVVLFAFRFVSIIA